MSQIKRKFIADDAVNGTKLRLDNNEGLRARNAANSADVDVLKLNASNVIELASLPIVGGGALATQAYVDSAVGSAGAGNTVVRVAVDDTAIDLATPGASIGGVTLATGDLLMLRAQANQADNGIYVFDTPTTPLERAIGWEVAADFAKGKIVFVREGKYQDSTWSLSENVVTLGTDDINFNLHGFNPGVLSSDLVPSQATVYNLGTSVNVFGNSYVTNSYMDALRSSALQIEVNPNLQFVNNVGLLGTDTSGNFQNLVTLTAADQVVVGDDDLQLALSAGSITATANTGNFDVSANGSVNLSANMGGTMQLSASDSMSIQSAQAGVDISAPSGSMSLSAQDGITMQVNGTNQNIQIGTSGDGHVIFNPSGSGYIKMQADLIMNDDTYVLRFNSSDPDAYVGFKAPTVVPNTVIYTLPDADGTAGQLLSTNGTGSLSWSDAAATGANTSLSNLTTTSINADLLPATTLTHAIGDATLVWSTIYSTQLSTYHATGTLAGNIYGNGAEVVVEAQNGLILRAINGPLTLNASSYIDLRVDIRPVTDESINLGSASNKFATLYVDTVAGSDGANVLRVDDRQLCDTTGALAVDFSGSDVVVNKNIDLQSGFRLIGLANPVAINDAANKGYVDAVATGLGIRMPCFVATVANLPTNYVNGTAGLGATLTANANGVLNLDGAFPAVGQRVLVKDQDNAFENGIYVVTDAGSVGTPYILTRSDDYDNTPVGEIIRGSYTFIQVGDENQGKGFVQVVFVDGDDVGVDPIAFAQFSAAGAYNFGSGLTISGQTVSVDLLAAGGLEFSGNQLSLKLNGAALSGLSLATDGVSVLVDDLTVKNTANGLEGLKPLMQLITLTPTDITNGYVDLGVLAHTNTVLVMFEGGSVAEYGAGADYTTAETGGVTRITFGTAYAALAASGDKLVIFCSYL